MKPTLTPVFDSIAALSLKIQRLESRIERVVSKRYPEPSLLRQVAGVGPLTALSYVLNLEDPQRFKSSHAIGLYLGLRPRQSQSGDLDPEPRITKARDSDLRRWGLALAAKGRKNAKKRAVVAVARRLSALLHRLWVTAEVYESLRRHRATIACETIPA